MRPSLHCEAHIRLEKKIPESFLNQQTMLQQCPLPAITGYTLLK